VISLADVDPDRLLAIYDALQFDPQPTA
jgi:hypothetical protein